VPHQPRRTPERRQIHELDRLLLDDIEVFYNRPRHKAGLGHLTPGDYKTASEVA